MCVCGEKYFVLVLFAAAATDGLTTWVQQTSETGTQRRDVRSDQPTILNSQSHSSVGECAIAKELNQAQSPHFFWGKYHFGTGFKRLVLW